MAKKRKRLKTKKSKTIRSESSVSIRTITDKDNRFMVGMKLANPEQKIVQLILLKPPSVPSVLDSLPPEELLAVRDFIGRVVEALGEQGFKIAMQWRR